MPTDSEHARLYISRHLSRYGLLNVVLADLGEERERREGRERGEGEGEREGERERVERGEREEGREKRERGEKEERREREGEKGGANRYIHV